MSGALPPLWGVIPVGSGHPHALAPSVVAMGYAITCEHADLNGTARRSRLHGFAVT